MLHFMQHFLALVVAFTLVPALLRLAGKRLRLLRTRGGINR